MPYGSPLRSCAKKTMKTCLCGRKATKRQEIDRQSLHTRLLPPQQILALLPPASAAPPPQAESFFLPGPYLHKCLPRCSLKNPSQETLF